LQIMFFKLNIISDNSVPLKPVVIKELLSRIN
jgi:hypothetical protein